MSALDRDAAREVLVRRYGKNAADMIVLDALEGCVRPASVQTIDPEIAALLGDLHRATGALALELPAAVWDDYTKRLGLVLALLREPAPAQTIDRDALVSALTDWLEDDYPFEVGDTSMLIDEVSVREGAERILALLRPVDGSVTLTRDEAEHAADWHDFIVDQGGAVPPNETRLALRLRAGAAS